MGICMPISGIEELTFDIKSKDTEQFCDRFADSVLMQIDNHMLDLFITIVNS